MNKIVQEFSNNWIGVDGVIAIAEGYFKNKYCIHVYVSDEFSDDKKNLPDSYKGLEVIVEQTNLI